MHRPSAAAVLLLGLTGMMFGACDSDEDSNDLDPLLGNTWTLASASDGGAPVEVPQAREIHWRFLGDGGCGAISLPCPDGQKLVGNDVCNDFVLSLHVDADRIVWGDEGATTAAACPGGLTDTLDDYFQDDFSRYLVTRDQLRLTSSDDTIELTFRESDGE